MKDKRVDLLAVAMFILLFDEHMWAATALFVSYLYYDYKMEQIDKTTKGL